MASAMKVSLTIIHGGVSMGPQITALTRGVDIVIACPGRLLDHMQYGYAKLDKIEFLVLDEADRMLDMGFLPEIKKILRALTHKRQTMFFSATMPRSLERRFGDAPPLPEPPLVNGKPPVPVHRIRSMRLEPVLASAGFDHDGHAQALGDDRRRLERARIWADDQARDSRRGQRLSGLGRLPPPEIGQPWIDDARIGPRLIEDRVELGLAVAHEQHGGMPVAKNATRGKAR